jgi:hypothetical protein
MRQNICLTPLNFAMEEIVRNMKTNLDYTKENSKMSQIVMSICQDLWSYRYLS